MLFFALYAFHSAKESKRYAMTVLFVGTYKSRESQ
jgi:hypothetical protein